MQFSDGRLDDNNIDGVLTLINAGLSEMSLDHDWDWLYAEGTITTVAGTEGYSTPTSHLRTAWLAEGTNLLSLQQRRKSAPYYGTTGYPSHYSVLADSIRFSPIPDGVYTIRHGYYTYIPKVTAANVAALSSTTISIPAPFESLAALYIAKQIALSLKDQQAYSLVVEEIRAEKQRLEDNVRRAISPMPPATRGDWTSP